MRLKRRNERTLTLFDVTTDASQPSPDIVRVLQTHIGRGVFAVRRYPAGAVIGEITGRVVDDACYSSDYTFDLDGESLQLDPYPPFCYLNHCCDPNCEFDLLEETGIDDQPIRKSLYVIALRDIEADEQLTIDYNWPARYAIRCDCESPLCRGWVVAHDELSSIASGLVIPRGGST